MCTAENPPTVLGTEGSIGQESWLNQSPTTPWIAALWFLFATLPYHSLGWLRGHWKLAFALGAIGGPLSYLGGVRMGAVEVGPEPLWTWIGLGVEYAVITPAMLALVRSRPASGN